ncbi:hypothetical protein D3C72_1167710 [compost metagenome]
MRTEPPWSVPMAMSASPAPTSAAAPDEEPPAACAGLRGLRTGPAAPVWLLPDTQKYSQWALPTMRPPASRMRVATVASWSGT